jgi:transposase
MAAAISGEGIMGDGLFDDLPEVAAPARERSGAPRLRKAERSQVSLHASSLDDLIAADHPARLVWRFVEGLDVSELLAGIRSVEGHVGHPAADPRILVALWLFATIDGVGSARRLAALCGSHAAYRWLCGGVSMNHKTLSDLRTAHADWLDRTLTASVAVLLHKGLVRLERVAQDGMKVRASAGAASFRRRESLEACRREAAERVRALKAEVAADPAQASRRQRAAQIRAAVEREARIAAALAALPAVAAKRPAAEADTARVSTTDPQARVMKMADGGFRPAFNVQFAAETEHRLIVGVAVSDSGGDQPHLEPMAEQIAGRFGTLPRAMLADGGFVNLGAIDRLERRGVALYAPPMTPRDPTRDPTARMRGDTDAVLAWRRRMESDAAKAIYKERAATIECVNAQVRNRGLRHVLVRGLKKVRAVALWHALAHNLRIAMRLLEPIDVTA